MKEYIKKFESAVAADNYAIADIPFTTSVAPSSGYPSINYIQNLVCNQSNKKLVNNNGIVSIYSDEPVIPNDEIWYTTTDGEPIDISGGGGSGSGSGSAADWPEYEILPYEGGKGVIKFTEDLTEIPEDGFSSITNLETIILPNSVTCIGDGAFYNCTSLTSVTIPNSVTSIGDYAFAGCSSLTSIVVENENTVYDSRDNCNAIIETATNTLIAGCKNTNIPNSVTSIGEYAFEYCSGLTSVTIPNSVTSIGDRAFYECNSLTSVIINSNTLMNKAYSSYSNIKNIFGSQVTNYVIGNSVTGIGNYAFNGCTSLTSVTIPNSVISIGEEAFNGCEYLTNVIINSNALVNKMYSTSYSINDIFGSQVTNYVIGNSVTGIGDCAFYGCTGLTYVTIGDSVIRIGEDAFCGCTSLTSVTIPNSVTSIEHYAFAGCSRLTSITIPDSVISIGRSSFYNCSGLTNVTIGNSVASIGKSAFENCTSLISIEIPNSVTSIGENAFETCSGLTSVTIPNSVTSIGVRAFAECWNLTSISYDGTMSDWNNNITLGEYWKYEVPATVVHCTDGDVNI